MFGYNLRQRTSIVIETVKKSLNQRFNPENVGINTITRQNFIERHVTTFAKQLYNPEPQQLRSIVFCDGTYFEVDNSRNFQTQKMSYSS